jgi:cytoskeletal protein RodZ
MILTAYILTALLIASVTFGIVGYGINNNIAAASLITQQQSSIMNEQHSTNSGNSATLQSQDSSQSTSTSDSVIISESTNSGGTSSSSSRIVTGTGNNSNFQIDKQSSGKIASSTLNLTTGEVEAVLFGNWSLNTTSGFVTNFTYKLSNGTGSIEYRMSGLNANSVNQINDNLVLAGTIDVISNNRTVLQDTPVTIMIQNGILVVGFENATETTNLFGAVPIIGFKQ